MVFLHAYSSLRDLQSVSQTFNITVVFQWSYSTHFAPSVNSRITACGDTASRRLEWGLFRTLLSVIFQRGIREMVVCSSLWILCMGLAAVCHCSVCLFWRLTGACKGCDWPDFNTCMSIQGVIKQRRFTRINKYYNGASGSWFISRKNREKHDYNLKLEPVFFPPFAFLYWPVRVHHDSSKAAAHSVTLLGTLMQIQLRN